MWTTFFIIFLLKICHKNPGISFPILSIITVVFFLFSSATSDCIIFLFLGISLFKDEVLNPNNWHAGFILWSLLLCLVIRFLGTYSFWFTVFILLKTPSLINIPFLLYLSHVMRLWYFSSSVNLFFKRACAAIQWGWSDPSPTSILCVCEQRRLWWDCANAQACLSLCWSPMW